MKNKKYIQAILAAVAGILLLLPAMFRDIKLESAYPSDLRNRQVGSRLIEDGKLPYFFHYKGEQDMRYLDIKNCGPLKVSNITATPYLHELFIPICDLPFRTFSTVWFVTCYLLLVIMYLLMQRISNNNPGKVIIWLTIVLFPYTEAWKTHIYQGQYYLLIPFLLVVFYWAFVKDKRWLYLLVLGTAAISLVLIRPTAILFLLPFVFLIKLYKKQFFSIILLGIIAITCIMSSSFQRDLWNEYRESVKEQVKVHQHDNPTFINNPPCPDVPAVEGFKLAAQGHYKKENVNAECGNVHVLWQMVFKQKLPLNFLYAGELLAIMILLFFFFFIHRKDCSFSLLNACFMGFALLMMADLCAPISRTQYNTVQWLFPLLLIAQLKIRDSLRWYVLLLWIGLLLNIVNLHFIKMEHTIGEYLMLLACMGIGLQKHIGQSNRNKRFT